MTKNKFTLKEAVSKKLLLYGEKVYINELYYPYKVIFLNRKIFSLNSFFGENSANVYFYVRSEGTFYARFAYTFTDGIYKSDCNLIATKLLSDEMFGIKAENTKYECTSVRECKCESDFDIDLPPNLIVEFRGEDEEPYIQLPPHTAYTFDKAEETEE